MMDGWVYVVLGVLAGSQLLSIGVALAVFAATRPERLAAEAEARLAAAIAEVRSYGEAAAATYERATLERRQSTNQLARARRAQDAAERAVAANEAPQGEAAPAISSDVLPFVT